MRKRKDPDPLPLLLEATRRALWERLAREPFCSTEVEEQVAGLWNEIAYTRAKASRDLAKYRGRGPVGA